MKTKINIPLFLAFIIVGIMFLLLCGGLITMTMINNGIIKDIGWMWTPAIVSLFIVALLGWALFLKKG